MTQQITKFDGYLTLVGRLWHFHGRPEVMLVFRRVFPGAQTNSRGQVQVAHTMANCRDLEWFASRYTLDITPADGLTAGAQQHRENEKFAHEVMEGIAAPAHVELAVPLRDYQRVFVTMAWKMRRILCGDDVGLGKSASAIGCLVDPTTRPALVVTMTHLTTQWEREINRFAPGLTTWVLPQGNVRKPIDRAGKPYDVIVCNYHKLDKWQYELRPYIRGIVWDEVQELRRDGSQRYKAAKYLASNASFVCGLSATPISNYGIEFFNVYECITPGMLGTREEFKSTWCSDSKNIKHPVAFGHYLRSNGMMLRRTRKEAGRELPPLQKIVHEVDSLTEPLEAVKRDASALARLLLDETRDHKERFTAAGQFDMKLRQSTGIAKAGYVADFIRMLVESGEKVLVGAWHHECFARGTRVLMYSGATKAVEEVREGDLLMGPDNNPRKVSNLVCGNGPMMRITPVKGAAWECSANHVLALRHRKSGALCRITASQFAALSPRSQNNYQQVRADTVVYAAQQPVFEPWLVGYWLGNGCANTKYIRLYSPFEEVANELASIAERYALRVTVGRTHSPVCKYYDLIQPTRIVTRTNAVREALLAANLHNNKHIPLAYKTASVQERRELLAGLIDSDGHVYAAGTNSVGSACIISARKQLANDVAFVARSLGLAAYVVTKRRETTFGGEGERVHYAINISGDLTQLPMRVRKKKAPPRNNRKSVLRTGVTATPIEQADFFGFEVDGDHLFLLDDFTVVHNCHRIIMERLADLNPVKYTGEESLKQKEEARLAFVEGDAQVLVMSLRSGAGLDGLQKVCRTAVIAELDYTPSVHHQFAGRINRDGQTEPTVVYFTVSEDGSDPIIMDILGLKRAQSDGVVDLKEVVIEDAQVDEGRIRKLAQEYLARMEARR